MSLLSEKVAIVTGAGSGIGEAIAQCFASEGAYVVVSDCVESAGKTVTERIVEEGFRGRFVRADVRNADDCRNLIETAHRVCGRIDILVNSAGISTRGNIEDTTLDDWENIFATNVRGPFICTQQCISHMKVQGGGSIVNIGSINAYAGRPWLAAYSASKGALMTLTKNAAGYLSRYRIRVNQLNIGLTLTPTEHRTRIREGAGETWKDEAARMRPFGRLFVPNDIARAALYFASPESDCVTGSILDIEQYPVGAPPLPVR